MKQILIICFSSCVSTLVAVLICFSFFNDEIKKSSDENFSHLISQTDRIERTDKTSFTYAASLGKKSVVSIRSIQTKASANNNKSTVSGSGVIISPDGYIVSNHHVIDKANELIITLNDNKEYKAQVVGSDASTDIALLKIPGNDLPFLRFGNSDSLQIGEWVLAIGNPFRLQSTVTAGIVSAKAREINILEGQKGIEAFIQTDAAVNPGNSGGALVNTEARLIGVNSAIVSYSGKYEGFSFAIPANLVKKVIYDLKEYGTVQRGWMGITIIPVDAKRAEVSRLPFVKGVFIELVNKESASKLAGLKKGDIITSVNNVDTDNIPQYLEQISRYRPGDKLKIIYYRNGLKKSTDVILKNQLNSTEFVSVNKQKILTDLGFEIRDLDSAEKSRIKSNGVYVITVHRNSIISKTNMDPGFIVQKVNGKQVESAKKFINYLKLNKGEIVIEGIYESYPGSFPYSFQNN